MAEKTIIVAEFVSIEEAYAARGFLENESIQVVVTGDVASATNFSLFGRMPYAQLVRLHVPESQAERAAQILAEMKEQPPEAGWEAAAVSAVNGWTCHLCESVVEDREATECPDCGEARLPG